MAGEAGPQEGLSDLTPAPLLSISTARWNADALPLKPGKAGLELGNSAGQGAVEVSSGSGSSSGRLGEAGKDMSPLQDMTAASKCSLAVRSALCSTDAGSLEASEGPQQEEEDAGKPGLLSPSASSVPLASLSMPGSSAGHSAALQASLQQPAVVFAATAAADAGQPAAAGGPPPAEVCPPDQMRIQVGSGDLVPAFMGGMYTIYPIDVTVGCLHGRVQRRFRDVRRLHAQLKRLVRGRARSCGAQGHDLQLPTVFSELDIAAQTRGQQRLRSHVVAERQATLQRCFQALVDECPGLLLEAPVVSFFNLADADLPAAFVERVQLAKAGEAIHAERAGCPVVHLWAAFPRTQAKTSAARLEVRGSHLVVASTPWGHFTEYEFAVQFRQQGAKPVAGDTGVVRRRFRDVLAFKRALEDKLRTRTLLSQGNPPQLPAVWQELEVARLVHGEARNEPATVSSRRVLLQRCLRSLLLEAPCLLLEPLTIEFLRVPVERMPGELRQAACRQADRCSQEQDPELWRLLLGGPCDEEEDPERARPTLEPLEEPEVGLAQEEGLECTRPPLQELLEEPVAPLAMEEDVERARPLDKPVAPLAVGEAFAAVA